MSDSTLSVACMHGLIFPVLRKVIVQVMQSDLSMDEISILLYTPMVWCTLIYHKFIRMMVLTIKCHGSHVSCGISASRACLVGRVGCMGNKENDR